MQQPGDKIDMLFRSKMDGLEISPPEGAWSNIRSALTGMKANAPSKPGFFNLKTYLAGISILAVITTVVLLQNPDNKKTSDDTINADQTSKSLVENDYQLLEGYYVLPSPENMVNTNSGPEKLNIFPDNRDNFATSPKLTEQNLNGSPGSAKKPDDLYFGTLSEKKAGSDEPVPTEVPEDMTSLESKQKDLIELKTVQIPDAGEIMILAEAEINFAEHKKDQPLIQNGQKKIPTAEGIFMNPTPPANDYAIRDKWAAGIHITPDWIIYPLWPEKKYRGYTVEANIYRQWKDFNIQTGLGISVTDDLGSYIVDYSKWDVVGSYQRVDSLSFDTSGVSLSVTYWTTTVNVFDSIDCRDSKNTDNRYTYFQLPLLAAYKVFEYKRISAFVNGGPVLSVLVHKKEPALLINSHNVNIIKISNNTPVRFRTNIQLWGSFEFGYAVTSRFRLTLEPVIKYYVSPVYDKESATSKNPYSTGLRLGMKWSF